MTAVSTAPTPPRAQPLQYSAPLGTRWQKEQASAGRGAFDFPEDPQYVGPWMLGECVGKGASGRVKVARHRRTGQLAAVKILPLAPALRSSASLATQQAKAAKFRAGVDREIVTMKLMSHPNIMRIFDVYEGDGMLYLILEYVQGGELFDYLVNRGRMASPDALAYFRQIISGLNYAHTFSIIHRDLKPENILIAGLDPPLIKIADWGMAALAPPGSHLETSCGSPHYASPEIVNGDKYTGTASDIWSCGVILFALVTGRLPFDDRNVRTLLNKVKLGRYDMPHYVDPMAKDLIARMLVVDASRRITMPDILAHPWMQRDTPASIPYVPAPSLEALAAPFTAAAIDPSLLQSLRVICGRHASAAQLRADLQSPPGEGSLAKAFYFLLARHREATLAESGICMDAELERDGATVPTPRTRAVTKQYVLPPSRSTLQMGRIRVRTAAPPTSPPAYAPPPTPAEDVHLDIGHPRSRSRTPSPLGQRARYPTSAGIVNGPATTGMYAELDHQYASSERTRARTHGASLDIAVPTATLFDAGPWTESPVAMFESPPPSRPRTPAAPPCTPVIHAPVALRANAPAFVMPPARFEEGSSRRAVDHIAGLMGELATREDARGRGRDRRRTADRNRDAADKENWHAPMYAADGCHHALGFVKAPLVRGYSAHGQKDKKARPPPLDLHPVTSPIPRVSAPAPAPPPFLSSPPAGATPSPVAGEIRGWFSNLFHWRQTLALCSHDSVPATRAEAARLLGSFGVAIVGEDVGGRPALRCAVEDAFDAATGAHVLRAVRFRVEFELAPGAGVGGSASFLTMSPTLGGARKSRYGVGVGVASECTMLLVQEKGSVTTFRAVYARLRAEWQLDGLRSPAPPASPYTLTQPRFAIA